MWGWYQFHLQQTNVFYKTNVHIFHNMKTMFPLFPWCAKYNGYYSFSQLLTPKKRKFGTICTTFTSCTNRSTQFGTTSHSLICIRLWLSFFTLWCQLHITLLSKHNTQCSVVAHTSQVKSQSINLQHTNSQISKHSGRLSNLQWGLQHKSALSLCFVW